jgi:two-component system cell cycle sensor histidine kinase/response regulator CckA
LKDDEIKVLLIEDNPSDARLLKETFSEVSTPIFNITHVDRLNVGLQHLAWTDFDVILLDLTLPDASGLETLLQVHAVSPEQPILVLTGLDDEGLATKAMQEGAQDYLVKAEVDRDLLLRAIRYAIERKRAEVERQRLIKKTQNQAFLVQGILDAVKEGIITLRANQEVIIANPAGRRYLQSLAGIRVGQKLEHLGDKSLAELLSTVDEHLPKEVILDGPEKQFFEVHASPSPLGQGERGVTLLIRDVTEARHIQMRARDQERQAAVGQLASGIAHDFNNIMGSIILYGEMLLANADLEQKDRQRLQTVMEQAHRAAALTRQILDFSRSGLLEPYRIDLVPFFEQISKLLSRTLPENIRLILMRKEKNYIVNADPVRLQQVLMNLAVNARDAMPNGGELCFRLERFRFEDEHPAPLSDIPMGEWVRISVTDTGMGIGEDALPHIFEPFFTTKEPGKGSGLGLAQVYGIIKQHEGYVDVESQPGQGTTIYLYLPAHSGCMNDALIMNGTGIEEGRATLLVVEDDEITRTAVSETLRAHHYNVMTAPNGQEAIKMIESHKEEINLILSDIVMPGISGETLCRQMQVHHPEIEVMIMTGYPMEQSTRELFEKSGVTWLAKPIHSQALVKAVQKALSSQRSKVAEGIHAR